MSSKPAEQDPSIEEILASIRQIITDDDPKTAEAAPPAAAEPTPVAAAAPVANDAVPATVEDVFELVDRVIAEEPEPVVPPSVDVADPFDALGPAVMSAPEPPPPVLRTAPAEPLDVTMFTQKAAQATEAAFARLSETIVLERQRAVAGATVTLEDIVKELLQPILRGWVDHHMPAIADRLVREELEKIARAAREG